MTIEEKFLSLYPTQLGCGAVVASMEGISEVILPFESCGRDEMKERLRERFPFASGESDLSVAAASALSRYFRGEAVFFDFPLDLHTASEFRRNVYSITAAIPYGEFRTYGEVAVMAGRPGGARGVGGALAGNPVPVIVPCHRVVAATGELTGFTAPGGVAAKRWLLSMEGVKVDRLGRALRS